MRTVRVFSTRPLKPGETAELGAAAAAHVGQVLRMRAGQPLTLFDGRGGEYAATLTQVARNTLHVEVGAHAAIERESPLQVTLWPALTRGARMDTVMQKATELGVTAIQPVICARGVVKVDARRAERKLQHWRDIVISACEQCGRNRLPDVRAPAGLDELLAAGDPAATRLLLAPDGAEPLTGETLTSSDVVVLSGPEGGFTAAEADAARRSGFISVQLGPRVLRTETAPLAAVATLQTLAGDFASRTATD